MQPPESFAEPERVPAREPLSIFRLVQHLRQQQLQ
jgi:hypothetical protein